jgi:peroxiredoxin
MERRPMTDDRPFGSFGLLDRPVEPDPAFADRLYASLAGDLGFRPVAPREMVVRRLRGAWPAVRMAYVAATLGLLLIAAFVAALAGSQLHLALSAEEIVAASQAAELDPPPFDMTSRSDDGRVMRVATDGYGAWRIEWLSGWEMPDGTFEVRAGGQRGFYDPEFNTWTIGADDRGGGIALGLTWERPRGPRAAGAPPDWFQCPSWRRLDDDIVAGRPAYHLACDGREFWVDTESSLLMAVSGPSGDLAGFTGRATALAIRPAFTAETFAMNGPRGAVVVDPLHPPVSTVLAVGTAAPRWTAAAIDGTTVDTGAQTGPLVVYFWATWCEPCTGPLTDLQTVAEAHASTVNTVTVATGDLLGSVTGYVDSKGIRLPVVVDDERTAQSWGIAEIPVVVMIDRAGLVAAADRGPLSTTDLEAMYAALEAGQPIPAPVATPLPSVEPGATASPVTGTGTGSGETISGLAIGDPMPHWTGPLLGGGTLDGSALLGKPTVIWFGVGGCTACPFAALQELETAHRRAGTSANVVIIASGEPTPGWTAAKFNELGITVPLVFDWDQGITRAFQLNILPTIVLDASGRVVAVSADTLSADEIGVLLDEAAAAGSPSAAVP